MFRHISALAAVACLSFAPSVIGCAAPTDEADAVAAEESSSDLVSSSAYFETFQGLDGHYYFSMTAANGQNVLRSQGYTKLASAQNGVASVIANGNDKRQFDVKQATNGDWYFVLRAANNEIIGTSEMYSSTAAKDNGIASVVANAPDAKVVDRT